MTTTRDIYNFIDSFAPYDTQCDWDNAGLLIGSMERKIDKAVLSLDADIHTVEFAKENNAQLILSHHPIIFHPVSHIEPNTAIYKCIENHIDVLSSHTNFDLANGGINTNLAQILELNNIRQIEGTFMTVGELDEEESIDAFAQYVRAKLHVHGIRYTKTSKLIKTVALIGGAAGEYADLAMANADCYITGEVPHHIKLYCSENGFAIIEAGHFETESRAFKLLKNKLDDKFNDVEFLWAGSKNPVRTL